MKTKFSSVLFLAGAALIIVPSLVFAQSWSDPTALPPNNNSAAPLNVSSAVQAKGSVTIPTTPAPSLGSLFIQGDFLSNTVSTNSLFVNGTATAQVFLYESDRTLKTNISTLTNALANVLKLRGVSFNWKNTGAKDDGVIAQEVQQVYPELVHTDPQTGIESVEYGNLAGVFIEAIKEQQAEITQQQTEITQQQAEIDQLKKDDEASKN